MLLTFPKLYFTYILLVIFSQTINSRASGHLLSKSKTIYSSDPIGPTIRATCLTNECASICIASLRLRPWTSTYQRQMSNFYAKVYFNFKIVYYIRHNQIINQQLRHSISALIEGRVRFEIKTVFMLAKWYFNLNFEVYAFVTVL